MKNVWSLPNLLSMVRIVVIPIIVLGILVPKPTLMWVSIIFYTIAALSDIFDGFIARQNKKETRIGYYLDPLADKILNLSILIALVRSDTPPSWFVIPVMLILSREISVTALFGIAKSQGIDLPKGVLERTTEIVQFVGILALLVYQAMPVQVLLSLGLIGIVLATGFYLYSALEYGIYFSQKDQKVYE